MSFTGLQDSDQRQIKSMLFDVFFFGFPIIFALCLGAHAVREEDARFWRPAFSFFAYCAFYLAGGRDVILYILCGFMIGGSWLSVGNMPL